MFKIGTFLLLCLSLFCQIKIDLTPVSTEIFKIDDDLGFENWNVAFTMPNLQSLSDIDRIELTHSSSETPIQSSTIYAASFDHYITQKNGEFLFRNLHVMLPKKANVNTLKITLYKNDKSIGTTAVSLTRYKQKGVYHLPLEGAWFVSSGYDFGVEHRRHLSRGHFAWDFIRVDKNGRHSSGDRLEDNFAFAQPILAAGDGTVIGVLDSEADNIPKQKRQSKKPNFIEIDHGNGEISRYVHLQQGSATVRIGDTVKQGDRIAAVGNSGFSDTPHLHIAFHREVQNSDGTKRSEPLPILFSNYMVSWNRGDHVEVKQDRPRRGQFVWSNFP